MYATQKNKRTYSDFARRQAKGITSKTVRVRNVAQTSERPCPNTTRAENHRTEVHFANGFLKHRFLPKVATNFDFKGVDTKKMENDLQRSFQQMATHYGFTPFDMGKYEFPYNVALALSQVNTQLQKEEDKWCEVRIRQDNHQTAFFSVEETYNTHQTLFFIPVLPIYKLLKSKDRNRKKAGHLLLSVLAYLNNKACVSYYTQDNDFLGFIYDHLQEWFLSGDWENPEEIAVYLCNLRQAQYIGNRMYQKIRKMENLHFFAQRIQNFVPYDDFEIQTLQIARDFYALWEDFPTTTIFQHIHREDIHQEDEMPEEYIFTLEKYVSFVFEIQSDLFEYHIMEFLNSEVSQCETIERPTLVNRFDGKSSLLNFDFEARFFSLLHQVINLLNII